MEEKFGNLFHHECPVFIIKVTIFPILIYLVVFTSKTGNSW